MPAEIERFPLNAAREPKVIMVPEERAAVVAESQSVLPLMAMTVPSAAPVGPFTVIPGTRDAEVTAERPVPASKITGLESVSRLPPEMLWMVVPGGMLLGLPPETGIPT